MAPIPAQTLFTLPIPAHDSPAVPSKGGTITVQRINDQTSKSALSSKASAPKRNIYLLTFTSPPDARLTPAFNTTFLRALTILQHTQPPGLLITTSGIPKFYSNGLDLSTAVNDPTFKPHTLYPLWRKLLTYPMPTCALINGHGFAGGLMLAMCHDYRVMNPHKGYLCLNELEFDAELSPAMSSIFKAKVSNTTFRNLILEARRFGALAALDAGIIDGVGEGWQDAVAVVDDAAGVIGKVSLKKDCQQIAYGRIKEKMYSDVIRDLDMTMEEENAYFDAKRRERASREGEEKRTVEEWKVKSKAKL